MGVLSAYTVIQHARLEEHRGFFLSPRQAPPLGWIDQETDAGSVSTLWRNGIYLFLMGLLPILLAGYRFRRICRGNDTRIRFAFGSF